MRKMILVVVALLTLIGCVSGPYSKYTTNDVPTQKRRPPTGYPTLLISSEGPQLDRKYYEIMGRVISESDNITVFENHCQGAIQMLRYEAKSIGADAVTNIACGSSAFGARASGWAIVFKDREEATKVLEKIGAVLK
jgi:uncharacterized protein YbjQ (UPF0145 family)